MSDTSEQTITEEEQMNGYTHTYKQKIIGICKTTKDFIRLQYKDHWGVDDSYDMPVADWKKMGKPYIGDYIMFEVTTSE